VTATKSESSHKKLRLKLRDGWVEITEQDLACIEGSRLKEFLEEPASHKNEEGQVLLDREVEPFRYALQCLREGKRVDLSSRPSDQQAKCQAELDYWGLFQVDPPADQEA